MAHFLRGKQAGIQRDFSDKITADLVNVDDLRRIGVSSQIATAAYDPVQGTLAVGTRSSKFGPGQIYIFGKGRISVTLPLPSPKASARVIQFSSDRLLCLDDRNDLNIYSLPERRLLTGFSPPGAVTALASDPTLDYALLGLASGEILAYDIDREALAPFRLPCFWAEVSSRAKSVGVVSMQFHPRDIGKLLIGYVEGAVIYSFKQNKPQHFLHYHVPSGAPGGDPNPGTQSLDRNPLLTHAGWHPTGTFVLTAHDDTSLVFWDTQTGRRILARTLDETHVDQPGAGKSNMGSTSGRHVPKLPYTHIAWCANQDPDDTALLIGGGNSTSSLAKGLTLLELGRTPNYTTSSWDILASHLATPRKQKALSTPFGVQVSSFCLIPRQSPWFAGAQDPVAILAILDTGEITTMSFPSGHLLAPTSLLPVSLILIHPFVTCISGSAIDRQRWLGITETRSSNFSILRSGSEGPRMHRRGGNRHIIQTAHSNGTIRIWDMGYGDEVENESVCQADVARAVGRADDVLITRISLSGPSGELTAGLKSGEVVIFRWQRNKYPGQEPPPPGANPPKTLTSITERKDPSLVEGFHPYTLLDQKDGPVTAVKTSDVGFIAAAFEGGTVAVIDMRGPAVIFNQSISDMGHKDKQKLFSRKRSVSNQQDYVSSLEFSVLTLEGEHYSSILLHAGTFRGQVMTLKILPCPDGRYGVEFAGTTSLEDRVIKIHPLNAATGEPAFASPIAVGNLRSGIQVDGAVLAVTRTEARIFRPASGRGANKSWDAGFCDCAAVVKAADSGYALAALFGDGTARVYSIPGLSEISKVKLDDKLDVKRFSEAVISDNGCITGWTGPSELALLDIWGTGQQHTHSHDKIFDPQALIPPRPTISNFQWISGSQYITPSDMDILIGGPDRPPSKRMIAQMRADELAHKNTARASSTRASLDQDEGYWAYMQRQINERTEKLGIMGDSMDRLEDNSSAWSREVSKFVADQKRNLVMGAVKSKFGF